MEVRARIRDGVPPVALRSEADLGQVLLRAAEDSRAEGKLNVIYFEAVGGNNLSVVVGGSETVLGFGYGHGEPPYYASRGETSDEDPFLTAYVGMCHHTEFPRKWVVPFGKAEEAAAEFLRTGNLPQSVHWVEV